MFLKSLYLKNYCYYEEYKFNFMKSNGKQYPFICFFGPNGFGKSSVLEAITLLTMNTKGVLPFVLNQRLRKYVHSEEYKPGLNKIQGSTSKKSKVDGNFYMPFNQDISDKTKMVVEGVFDIDGDEYVVTLNENGFSRNDLAPVSPPESDPDDIKRIMSTGPWGEKHFSYRQRVSYFMSTDSDLSLSKFQLRTECSKEFEKIMNLIMHFPVKCMDPLIFDVNYCIDFVLHKTKQKSKKIIKTHYKSMSAGERKIAKMFSQVLNMIYELENPRAGETPMSGFPALLLIDNIEMHAYYDRHSQIVNCLKDVFNKQQIFATTHSGVLIQKHKNKKSPHDELWIDLEPVNN